MAKITVYKTGGPSDKGTGFDFSNAFYFYNWNVSVSTSSIQLYESRFQNLVTYSGTFTFSGSNLDTVSGTVSSVEFGNRMFGYTRDWGISGIQANAHAYILGTLGAANTQGALAFALSGNDAIIGGALDDVLIGYAGNDVIDGGDGTDTAVYRGVKGNYSITTTTSGVAVTDITGRDGSDVLTNIEYLRFANQTVSVGSTNGTSTQQISNGKAVKAATTGNDLNDTVLLQPDGKILVAGASSNTGASLVRVNADGTIDAGFSANGVLTNAFMVNAQRIALQPDGKILTIGTVGGVLDFGVMRFTADGHLDTSFNGSGAASVSFSGGDDYGAGVLVQPDGKILVSGAASGAGYYDQALARFNSNGTLDSTFGNGGKVVADLGGYDGANVLLLQRDQKIIAIGNSGSWPNTDFAVVRYNPNGTLDKSFGVGGKAITSLGSGQDIAYAGVLQVDGKILVAGTTAVGATKYYAVARYNADGSVDTGFNGTGVVRTSMEVPDSPECGLAIQADGRVVIVGSNFNGVDSDFAVARYNSDGSVDPTFGNGGMATTSIGDGDDQGHGVAIQTDGHIIASGTTKISGKSNFAVVRYNMDGSLDTQFNHIDSSGSGGTTPASGGSGNDFLAGTTGADKLVGGAGDDIYIIDNLGDKVLENDTQGNDTGGVDTVRTSLNRYPLGANVENLERVDPAQSDNFTGTGNELDNRIFGGAGNDVLDGKAGRDVLSGSAGNDKLTGGVGDDILLGGDGSDTMDGGLGDDTVFLDGNRTDYTFSRLSPTQIGIAKKDGSENDQMINVEHVHFGDGAVAEVTLDDLLKDTASAFDDKYQGTDADDQFDGLAGNDSISGGKGSDRLTGGLGNDTLDGGAGSDSLTGGLGNDTYIVDTGASTNPDPLPAIAGDVVIEALNGGVDKVQTSLPAYTLGANLESLDYLGTPVAVLDGNGVPTGANQVQQLAFTGSGNELANTITGGAGNDTLDGGKGIDRLIGGQGNDTYMVDTLADKVIEKDAEGTDAIQTALTSFNLAAIAYVENLGYRGLGNFIGGGNELANVLTGNIGNDSLDGGKGDDTLVGGAGNDLLKGGDGIDTVVLAGDRADYVFSRPDAGKVQVARKDGTETDRMIGVEQVKFADGSTAQVTLDDLLKNTASGLDDFYQGDGGRDVFDGLAGNDHISGDAGDDSLAGGAGNDTLDGGQGNDTLRGGAGDDLYVVDNLLDIVSEKDANDRDTGGKDTIRTGLASYALGDYLENLTYTGVGEFFASGNSLNNVISGGIGNDTLNGGLGRDTLIGGAGNDTYVIDNRNDKVVVVEKDALGTDAGGIDVIRTSLSSFTLPSEVENLVYTGTGNFSGTGHAGKNTIVGGDGNDTLSGREGDDVLDGGRGADRIEGGTGIDTVRVAGSLADYAIDYKSNGTVTLTSSGVTDTLLGVERIVFDSGTTSISDDTTFNLNDRQFRQVVSSTGNIYQDAVFFAMAAYYDDHAEGTSAFADILDEGWQPVTLPLKGSSPSLLGYPTLVNGQYDYKNAQAAVFSGTLNRERTIVLSYRGTDITDPLDLINDKNTLAGFKSHFDLMAPLNDSVLEFARASNVHRIVVTGHSLGGAMVEWFLQDHPGNPMISGITFAAPGIGLLSGNDSRLTHFQNSGDLIAPLFAHTGATTIHLDPQGASALNGHGLSSYLDTVTQASRLGLPFLTANGTNEVRTQSDYYVVFDAAESIGNPKNNLLNGNSASELILGRFGKDTLVGGYGNDTLTGGGLEDRFVFDNSGLQFQQTGIDTITDFQHGVDKIVLDNDAFTGLQWSLLSSMFQNAESPLDSNYFRSGKNVTGAGDANDRIIVDTASGMIYYDADGTGFVYQSIAFATVQKSVAASMSASDFFVSD